MAKRALGKGLSALIGDTVSPRSATQPQRVTAMLGDREAIMLPLGSLRPNPQQPRKSMDEGSLQELADSIRRNGILQPVLARRVEGGFELVAGERRFRAAALAGLGEIPALVCTIEESESLKLALLENIQRENLDPIEEAEAYKAIMDTYGATHRELADMLGKKRSTVTNTLRLLSLESIVREMLVAGDLTMGHARALLAVEDREARVRLARHTTRRGLSVRALEHEVRRLVDLPGSSAARRRRRAQASDPESAALRQFEERLRHHLGCPSSIQRRGRKGRIELQFFSNEELEGILEKMGISPQL